MSESLSSSSGAPAAAKKNATPGELPAELFDAFCTIRNIARKINCSFAAPEVVFLGRRGAGKSSLIESFLGHTMMPLTETLRPVEIRMVNNPDCDTPRVTVLRDSSAGDAFPEEPDVALTDVQKSLQARNTARMAEPTRLLYESKYCMDMTVYDTPGLLHPTEAEGEDPEKTEEIVYGLAKPNNRLLVCVEEACEWGLIEGIDFINRVDPRHERTIFVFNKVSNLVGKFSSAPEVTNYFRGGTQLPLIRGGRVTDKVFFTNMPTGVGRSDKPAIFKRKIASLLTTQLQALDALQYDSRFEGNIGALAVQKRILLWVWNRYQNVIIPPVISYLSDKSGDAAKSKENFDERKSSISALTLRKDASYYASAWVSTISSLLNRNLIGRPALNGQTLAEECMGDDAFASWNDANMERLELDRNKVGGAQDKLYGAAQFERLLREFRMVVGEAVNIEISPDEAATALGSIRSDSAPDVAWAACYLVHQKCSFLFPPLVQQLVARAKALFVYLVEIADRLPHQGWVNADSLPWEVADEKAPNAEAYPRFVAEVKSMYYDVVDTLCKKCAERCSQEFYDAKVLNFELRNNYTSLLDSSKSSSSQKYTLQLTRALFEKVKERFVQNVTMTCYDMLLATLQTKLSHIILARVVEISDKQLNDLFETEELKRSLSASSAKYDGIIKECANHFEDLKEASATFARFGSQ